MKRQLMVQESWEKLGFGHWIDGKSETESELWWEEAHRAVWGHLDDLLLQQRACSTMAQEGALGVPVRSHSKSRQTPLPDRYTLWLRNGSSNEVSKRILDDSCSFRFPFPPRSVRVYLQVSCIRPPPTPPRPSLGRGGAGDICPVSGHCGCLWDAGFTSQHLRVVSYHRLCVSFRC